MLAKFLSYFFHPVFAPLFSVYILFQLPVYLNYKMPEEWVHFIYGAVTINLIICPLLVTLYFKKKGLIQSLEMNDVSERVYPYLISALFYSFTYYLLQSIQFPGIYLSVFAAATAAILVLLICAHLKFKMSAHLSALGGITGMLFIVSIIFQLDLSLLFIASILISGMVASARYFLKAHSFIELSLGFIIGFLLQVIFIGYQISG